MTTIIRGGDVYDVISGQVRKADILVQGRTIVRVADFIEEDCAVYHAEGKRVYPGFIDAHSHLGTDGYGIGYEGQDYNEMSDPICPQLRAIDGINPMQPTLPAAARAGVTTVVTGPGSANVLGGTFAAIKTTGICVDDMIVRYPVAMKCAFGENPKRCYRDKGISSRMTTASKLREALYKAREYMRKLDAAGDDESKKPAFDMKCEALLPVLRGDIPLKAHAHEADDIFTALRVAHEFGVGITLEHVTEGHLIADRLGKEKVPVAVGPSLTNASKFELRNKTWKTPAALYRAGLSVSIITDAPVIPQEYLPLCAGLAVKNGLPPMEALRAITINPARHAGIADCVGSLEAGKDADIVITDGCPFEVATQVQDVMINGEWIDMGRETI